MINRRDFVKSVAITSTTAAMIDPLSILGKAQASETASKRPNVLYIMADDLNDSVARLGGHPQAKTPHIDKLMSQGVHFMNAQANVPICGPSRACVATGFGPWTNGYYGYGFAKSKWYNNPVMKDAVTFMEAFGEAGYKVFATGKIMHNGQEKMSIWKDGYGHKVDWGPWTWDGKKESKSGWGRHAGHQNMPYFSPELAFGPLSDIPVIPPNEKTGAPGYTGWVNDDGTPFRYKSEDDRDLMHDEKNAVWAKEALSKKHDDPFLMCIGIGRPHSPLIAPKKYFDMFPLDKLKLAPQYKNDLDDIPEIMKTQSNYWGFKKFKMLTDKGPNMYKRWLQAYLASVAYADACIGQILDALAKSQYADNTLVVLTSDNGYHIGEKGSLHKDSCWEESCKVPLIISGPGVVKNEVCKTPVTLIDLYPTFIDRCGLAKDPNAKTNKQALDGHSLSPLLAAPKQGKWDGPSVAVSAVDGNVKIGKDELGKAEDQNWTARSQRYRYIRYRDGSEELYDHNNDPHEWKNLASIKEHAETKSKMIAALIEVTGLKI